MSTAPGNEGRLDPYQALGVAILQLVMKDAMRPDSLGVEAKVFLASEDVAWWAEALGLDPDVFAARIAVTFGEETTS